MSLSRMRQLRAPMSVNLSVSRHAAAAVNNARSCPTLRVMKPVPRCFILLWSVLLMSCATSESPGSASARAQILQARAVIDSAFEQRAFHTATDRLAEAIVVAGPVWRTSGRESLLAAYASLAAKRRDVRWWHQPADVQVDISWGNAFEQGTWQETWNEDGGLIQLSGSYSALWRRVQGQWMLEAEVFVPLRCVGGAYCKPRQWP